MVNHVCDIVTELAPDDSGRPWKHPRLWTPEAIHQLVMDEVGEDLLFPRGYTVLLKLYKPNQLTAGGLILPDHEVNKVTTQCTIGKVLRMGYEAWRDPARFPYGYRATYGEWVLFRGSERQKIKVTTSEESLAIISDDRIHFASDTPEKVITAFELEHEWAAE
jgi:co-chaperonin GroES (HSP10)